MLEEQDVSRDARDPKKCNGRDSNTVVAFAKSLELMEQEFEARRKKILKHNIDEIYR